MTTTVDPTTLRVSTTSPRTREPGSENPPAHARARARVEDPTRDSKSPTAKGGWISAGQAAARNWWAWTAHPASLSDAWAASTVTKTRVPGGSGLLTTIWRISNATDRLIMFGLILIAPTGLTGPLRWVATRPTRRYGTYALTGALLILIALHR